jgi:hypothetical protein
MFVCIRKHLDMSTKKVKIAFINPSYSDWSLCNVNTYLYMQSYYNRFGKYSDKIEWMEPPFKWDKYTNVNDVINEISDADLVMFSSYIWNYNICDNIAAAIPNKVKLLGGPHIGTFDEELYKKRVGLYDFICKPTKPGESFILSFLDQYLNDKKLSPENILWEMRSLSQKDSYNFGNLDYSIYEDHFDLLLKMSLYADQNKLEKYMSFESTRGCPYQCTFCEWGGGIGTKVNKKSIDIIERDFKAISKAGYENVYLNDANFGMLFDRDMNMYELALQHNLHLRDISTVKSKDLSRRKKIIDACDSLLTKYNETIQSFKDIPMIPTVSIQSASDNAMKIAKRIDLSLCDKIELSEYIFQKKRMERDIELILGMPGSTLEDFYAEYDLIWNFRPNESLKVFANSSWSPQRHDYMLLPDSELSNPSYIEKHDIQKVKVYVKEFDETGEKNKDNLYVNSIHSKELTYFYTMSSCSSYTNDEYIEMWIMNKCGVVLLRKYYSKYESIFRPSDFIKKSKDAVYQLPEMGVIIDYATRLFDVNSKPMSLNTLENGENIQEKVDHILLNSDIIEPLILNIMFGDTND